jgi:hypothetical protein
VEQGSHAELLNKGGYYTRLHGMQFHESADLPVPVEAGA